MGVSVLHMDPSTFQTEKVKLKLELCNGTITWASQRGPSVTLQNNNNQEICFGLRMKSTTKNKEGIVHLTEGFIDVLSLKTVELGFVDMLSVPKRTLSAISTCFKVC